MTKLLRMDKFIFILVLALAPRILVGQIRKHHPKDSTAYLPSEVERQKLRNIVKVPVALITAGALTMATENHTLVNKRTFQTEYLEDPYVRSFHYEDYTRDLPILAVYALNMAGVKGKNSFMERSILLAKTMLIQHILVSTLKGTIDMERPDGGEA